MCESKVCLDFGYQKKIISCYYFEFKFYNPHKPMKRDAIKILTPDEASNLGWNMVREEGDKGRIIYICPECMERLKRH